MTSRLGRAFRPSLVELEGRDVPASIIVTSAPPEYEDERPRISLQRDGNLSVPLSMSVTYTGTA